MEHFLGFLNRLVILIMNEWQLWNSSLLTLRQKFHFANSRIVSLPRNGSVQWFNHPFESDNKLGLLLLPSYLFEVSIIMRALERVGVELKSGFTVLDVGANVGQFSVTFMNSIPSSEIVSIEPNVGIIGYLEVNNQHNKHRWQLLPYGLSDTKSIMKLHSVPGKSAQGSFHEGNSNQMLLGNQEALVIEVPTQPFLLSEVELPNSWKFATPDLLKIDVEGFEKEAIMGLGAIRPKFVWIEVSTKKSVSLTRDEARIFLMATFERSVQELFQVGVSKSEYDGNILFQCIY